MFVTTNWIVEAFNVLQDLRSKLIQARAVELTEGTVLSMCCGNESLMRADGAIVQMVRSLQFLSPAQRGGLNAAKAVQGKTSSKLNMPAVLIYGVKTKHLMGHLKSQSLPRK